MDLSATYDARLVLRIIFLVILIGLVGCGTQQQGIPAGFVAKRTSTPVPQQSSPTQGVTNTAIIANQQANQPSELTIETTATTQEDMIISISVNEQRDQWTARVPDSYRTIKAPFPISDPKAIDAGSMLYQDNLCSVCHGTTGDGKGRLSDGLNPKPIDFTDSVLMKRFEDGYLFWRISEGGSQPPFLSSMPAWKGMLTEEQRWQLVAYLRSLQVGPMPNAATPSTTEGVSSQLGTALLQTYGCLACHKYATKGTNVGPALDDIGANVSSDFIRQSIVDPVADITKGYPNVMPRDYAKKISQEDLDLLVKFLSESTGKSK